jgi:hypothetical protein
LSKVEKKQNCDVINCCFQVCLLIVLVGLLHESVSDGVDHDGQGRAGFGQRRQGRQGQRRQGGQQLPRQQRQQGFQQQQDDSFPSFPTEPFEDEAPTLGNNPLPPPPQPIQVY